MNTNWVWIWFVGIDNKYNCRNLRNINLLIPVKRNCLPSGLQSPFPNNHRGLNPLSSWGCFHRRTTRTVCAMGASQCSNFGGNRLCHPWRTIGPRFSANKEDHWLDWQGTVWLRRWLGRHKFQMSCMESWGGKGSWQKLPWVQSRREKKEVQEKLPSEVRESENVEAFGAPMELWDG